MFKTNHWFGLAASVLFLTNAAAQADVVQTRIFRIEAPHIAGDSYEVLATHDGQVFSVAPQDKALLSKLSAVAGTGEALSLVLDDDRVIDARALTAEERATYTDAFDNPAVVAEATSALEIDEPSYSMDGLSETIPAPAMPMSYNQARQVGYSPTILSDMSQAQDLFGSERLLKHKSQCYERAHVWSYEMESSRSIKSMKVFMFFTSMFRNKFRTYILLGPLTKPYKWWFHVAPFVYVGDKEVVLDREFLPSAVSMDDWTFHFIGKVKHDTKHPNPTRGEARCQDAVNYEEFSKFKPTRYCVLRKVPMYYFQPRDMENLDCQGGLNCNRQTVPAWRQGDINQAYSNTRR